MCHNKADLLKPEELREQMGTLTAALAHRDGRGT